MPFWRKDDEDRRCSAEIARDRHGWANMIMQDLDTQDVQMHILYVFTRLRAIRRDRPDGPDTVTLLVNTFD